MSQSDEIADLVRDFDAAVAVVASVGERLRALQARAPQDYTTTLEFIAVSVAAFEARISDSRLRELCASHPLDAPGGFALRRGGRWFVHRVRFGAFCAAHPRRGRRGP